MRKLLLLFSTLLLLGFVNYGIYQREQLLEHGRIVLLELAPVDPRSLMQGDYMALRFDAALDAAASMGEARSGDGHLILELDERMVGRFQRIDDGAPLTDKEVRMRYRRRDGQMKFATNAFFFEEGQAAVYEPARYGEFRVADDGEALLTGLQDAQLRPLGVYKR